MSNVRYATVEDAGRIVDFLSGLSKDFRPSLDERRKTIAEMVDSINNRGKVALYERQGSLLGISAYAVIGETLHTEFTAVHRGYRNGVVLARMIEYIKETFPEGVRKVTAKTWPANNASRRVLEKLGFSHTMTQLDKDGKIRRVFYEKEL